MAEEQSYKYWAFISYSHQDRAWANWLHKSLETYRVPHRLVGREHWSGPLPRRLLPVFRDRDELPSSAELGSVLNEALRQSRYLIVICSPQSARSRWVNEEVKYFKSLGRSQRVLPLIIGGEPGASELPNSGLAECMPPAIRFEVDANGELSQRKAEPIAADARGGKDGRANAKLKLIAGLLSVGLDELKQRERQRKILRRVFTVAAAVAFTVLAGLGWHWQQNEKQHALEAQALKVRIAQLYENGREELLGHNEARAAVYLNEAYKLGVDTPALRYMLARAMRVVDAQASRVQTRHAVLVANLSPDGEKFLTVDQNWQLSAWSAVTNKKIGSYDLGATTQFFAAEYSDKGSLIWVTTYHSDAPARRLRIFSQDAQQLLAEFQPAQANSEFAASPLDQQDQRVAYLKTDFSIAVYTLETHRELHIPGRYSVVRFCKDQHLLLAGTDGGQVLLLDRDSGRLKGQFIQSRGAVVALDSSEGCKTITAGSSDGAVSAWDVSSGRVLMAGGHTRTVGDLHINASGTRIMSVTSDSVNIWNGRTGALLYTGRFLDPVSDLAAMSADGSRLATISNSRLAILDPVSAAELYTLDGHLGPARNFNFSAGTRKLVSSGSDGSVVIWNLPSPAKAEISLGMQKYRNVLEERISPEAMVQLNHSGTEFLATSIDGDGGLWRSGDLAKIAGLSGRVAALSAAVFSQNDQIVATGDWDGTLRFWNAETGAPIGSPRHLGGRVMALTFDASNHYLSAVIRGNEVTLRTIPEGEVINRFQLDAVQAQSFDPRGATYAIGAHGAVKLWDMTARKFLWSMALPVSEAEHEQISIVSFSPDGGKILVTLARRRAFILESRTGHVLQQINEPAAMDVYSAAFSANGRHVAFGNLGKSVLLWQLASNAVLKLQGHGAEVRAVAFSPDDALLVSAAVDGQLKIWDAENGALLDSIHAHDGAMSWHNLQFGPLGNTVLTVGADNNVRLWNMQKESRNPEQIAALLRCRVAWRASGTTLVSVPPETQGCSIR